MPRPGPRILSTISRSLRHVSDSMLDDMSGHLAAADRSELDSHADTCVAGSNCVTISTTGEQVTVKGFNHKSKVHNIPIGTVATAVDSSETGETFLLIINEALIFTNTMEYTLLATTQLRHNGIHIDETPRIFDRTSTHSITGPVTSSTGGETSELVRIPLHLRGPFSYLHSRKPTTEELRRCRQIILTKDEPWQPYDLDFARREEEVPAGPPDTSITPPPTKRRKRIYLWHSQVSALGKSDVAGYATSILEEEKVRLASAVCQLQKGLPIEVTCSTSGLISGGDSLIRRIISSVNQTSTGLYNPAETNPLHDMVSEGDRQLLATQAGGRQTVLTPELLAKRWRIGVKMASNTLRATTQRGIKHVVNPIDRRRKPFTKHLNYPTLNAKYYSDTFFMKRKSARGYSMAQVFTDGRGDTHFYPLKKKKEAGLALKEMIQDNGAMRELVTDGAKEEGANMSQSDTLWRQVVEDFFIKQSLSEPHSQWQNRAESEVRELKRGMWREFLYMKAPKRLWCFCGESIAARRRLSALTFASLQGRVPAERRLGNTPDISAHAQFAWYEKCFYIDVKSGRVPGRVLGVAKSYLSDLTFWVLTKSGKVIARSSVYNLTDEEERNPQVKKTFEELDKCIKSKIGDQVSQDSMKELEPGDIELPVEVPPDDLFASWGDGDFLPPEDEEPPTEVDDYTPDIADTYLQAEILIPRNGDLVQAKVVRRLHNGEGTPKGKRNENPMLDTREYVVEFNDGSLDTLTANQIAENIYSQVDSEGHHHVLLDEIIDHRKTAAAVSIDDGYIISKNGNKVPRKTTVGWELLVQWKDGSTSWCKLIDLKSSNPVETAEYAVMNKIGEEPAFKWWAKHVLRRRDRIISKIKKTVKKTHKYGIRVPRSVEEALQIDKETNTTFWRDAIEKEMKNVSVAFQFDDDDAIPVGHKLIKCHMIFDVKMISLQRKARFVAGGHMTDPPKESTYSSVVSRESVRLAFLAAALNGIDVLAADIQNAYLEAPTREKVYAIAGAEFGSNQGRPMKIVRALYGLKSSGKMFREHLAHTIRVELQFEPCKADGDVWMRKATKPNGDKYWEYILCYVDDILVVSHEPKVIMDQINEHYTLKKGSVKPPDIYLGAQIEKFKIEDSEDPDKVRWAFSSDNYVANAIQTVTAALEEVDLTFCSSTLRCKTPLPAGYKPELEESAYLDPARLNFYQGLIGILRWICELGRIDIVLPTALMSRYLVAPRWGHLEKLIHMFGYLKQHPRSKMVMDERIPDFTETSYFSSYDWSEVYPDAKEAVPTNVREARGNPVVMSCFEDADHAGDVVTRRSHTGILIFVNRAPILWHSKKQNTVESSTFGSEMIAMKTAVELIEGLRYKLRMMGFPIDGPCNVFCDNNAVVQNTSRPDSLLKKKHLSVAYHRNREAQAAGTIRIAKEASETNLSDILTKLMPSPKMKSLLKYILW